MRTDICVVGAGPAGLMAAIGAAGAHVETTLLEANANAGCKLLTTGGGRCNFTHAATIEELVRAYGKWGRFLRHSLHELPPEDVRAFFAERGVPSVIEPGGCVFPRNGRATDIREALVRETEALGVHMRCASRVTRIVACDRGFQVDTPAQNVVVRRVIVTTGGLSWPQTGSTGDGYRFAAALGHAVTEAKPALVPLITRESWPADLAGVSLKNVRLRGKIGGRKVTASGHLVFAYDGIGGSAAQDLSRALTDSLSEQNDGIPIHLDLTPEMEETALDERLQNEMAGHTKKTLVNIVATFLPKRLAVALCNLAGGATDQPANQVRKQTRRRLATLIKATPLLVTGTRPIAEATVTRGGATLDQIDRRSMESQACPGLYFAGEVIDADGPCGGYNLQMCFATGLLAGRSAARSLSE